uniref:Uncharacterized protein n=1 Tax=Phlebia radiata TaxID=5308 RepID=L8B981_PHLRA|nr:hypothetical protein PRA_mt0013 [Phlebia radiata]CCE89163.1 hypothetical protein PRA_mt0013 [Phlebia radiata]
MLFPSLKNLNIYYLIKGICLNNQLIFYLIFDFLPLLQNKNFFCLIDFEQLISHLKINIFYLIY